MANNESLTFMIYFNKLPHKYLEEKNKKINKVNFSIRKLIYRKLKNYLLEKLR